MPKLYWLDLETTGLDPTQNRILEVAVSVADLADPFNATPIYHAVLPVSSWSRAVADPFVEKMHTDNGLWDECAKAVTEIWDISKTLQALIPDAQDNYLAGNSIHFDLSFLREHMPGVAAKFSHRLYDVSAINLFALSLGMPPLPKETAHRAASDVEASICQAKALATWLGK